MEGATAMATVLKYNSTLDNINLDYNNIGDEGAMALAEALKNSSNLQILWHLLSKPNISNNIHVYSARFVADAWKQATKLSSKSLKLGLGGNKIGAKGGAAILEALKTSSTVHQLNLNQNNVGESLKKEIERELSAENREMCHLQLKRFAIRGNGTRIS